MQKYRFKFYLNAVHSIEINGIMGQEHPHTWEIGIDALKSDDSFVMFTAIEKGVEQLLSVYQDKNMNKVPPFDTINPTLENVSIYLKKVLEQFLVEQEWFLTRLEVSETPSRTFVIDAHTQAVVKNIKEKEQGKESESWLKPVENEIEKFIAEKSQKSAGHTQEDTGAGGENKEPGRAQNLEISFPHAQVKDLLLRERSRIGRSRKLFLLVFILGIGVLAAALKFIN